MATPKITNASEAAQSIAAVSVTPDYSRPLTIVTTLFFMWGFLTSLNDILVPHLKSIFELSYARVMLIQFAFFSAYFLFSVPWSKVVNRIGYQNSMVVGLLTMAVGAFLFLPAASAASYPLFLTALVIPRRGHHRTPGRGQPLRGGPRATRNRIQSAGPDAGFQLAWHHDRPENSGVADPERCAVRGRTVTATRATSAACVSRRASSVGQDAIHRDRRRPGVVGRVNRQFQAPKNRNRSLSSWREGQGFDLEASQSPLGRDRHFHPMWERRCQSEASW